MNKNDYTPPFVFRYFLNRKLRSAVHSVMSWTTGREKETRLDLRDERLKKILIVRATFRLGDSILAIPAIWSFRKQFPQARIDFVGAPISVELFQNLPIDNHFTISRRYPGSALDYPLLLWRLRSIGYDLAVDVSCSQSASGSLLVGFSRARYRIGLKGKWDHWFNVRIAKQSERNKYKVLPEFLRSLGLASVSSLPSLALSSAEKEKGKRKIQALTNGYSGTPTVGVFVGGRRTWGKRWPAKNFYELITALHFHGLNVITFIGPEEKNSIALFRDALDSSIPIVFEPSSRDFAAMVSNCDLFITCDSGPMHLACGFGIRTVAIFLQRNFDHWAPPSNVTRIVYEAGGCSAEEVLRISLEELTLGAISIQHIGEDDSDVCPTQPL
jgi:ADP-heptose:LPS heptosyltransferase